MELEVEINQFNPTWCMLFHEYFSHCYMKQWKNEHANLQCDWKILKKYLILSLSICLCYLEINIFRLLRAEWHIFSNNVYSKEKEILVHMRIYT